MGRRSGQSMRAHASQASRIPAAAAPAAKPILNSLVNRKRVSPVRFIAGLIIDSTNLQSGCAAVAALPFNRELLTNNFC